MLLTRRRRASARPDCADVVELVTGYLDGALPPELAERVSAHLAECDGCTVYVEQIRQTAAALHGVDLPGLPDEACAELAKAFRDFGPF